MNKIEGISLNTYVVAAIKSWNIDRYYKLTRLIKADWYLIDNKADLTVEKLRELKPRYIFFPHWSWLIAGDIYKNFECVVFHLADLPSGRGGSPLQHHISQGIYHTKVSALKANEGIDTGAIYLKRDICLNGGGEECYLRLANLIFFDMIPFIIRNEPIPTPQVGKGTIFKRRTPDMSKLPTNASLEQIYDFIRMLDAETYPPAFLQVGKVRVEFTRPCLRTGRVIADAKITLGEA